MYFLLSGGHGGAVGQGVALLDVLNARHVAVGVVGGEDGEHLGYLDARHDAERCAVAALFQPLGGGQFHGLIARGVDAALVACEHHAQCAQRGDGHAHTQGAQGELRLAAAQQVPAAHAYGEETARHPAAQDAVEELDNGYALEGHAEEVHHLVAHGVGVELHADGVLHPAVGHEYPPGRERGADAREPRGAEVELLADFVPAEEHHGDERRLHKEGHDALDGERCAENVAHEPGIVAPVRAELELKDDARGHAYGEVYAKELLPELGSMFPEVVLFDDVEGFHHAHHHGEAEREGHEQPVVAGGEGELRARPVEQRGRFHVEEG